MDFSKMDPNMMIFLFGGVLVLFLVGFIISKIVTGNKKKALRAQVGLAELVFDELVRPADMFVTDVQFQGYKLYAVNGNSPKVTGKSVFIPAGACSVDVEYIDTDYATRRTSLTTKYGRQQLEYTVQEGRQYMVTFNEAQNKYSITEK